MALKINLLPETFAVKGGLARSITVIKQLTVILLAVFILAVVGISGYFLVSSVELGRLTTNIDQLKAQITSQETVETQVVLLKDRVAKIKVAQKVASAQNSLVQINTLVSELPAGATLGELNLDSKKSDASIVFDSSTSLGAFFDQLLSSKNFSSIILTSFGFNPATGYLAGLRFTAK